MKKVSVILTTYNSEKTVRRIIDSIMEQEGAGKGFELELIVIDDCSTDSTNQILIDYPDIRIFNTGRNSGGPNKGRNIGLKECTGDYICIPDHDDKWHSNKIITLLPYLEWVPIVTSGYTLCNDKGRTERVNKSDKGSIWYEQNETFLKILSKARNKQNIYMGSIMFREHLKDIIFEEKYGMCDFDWVLKLFYYQRSIEVYPSLYTRYVDGNNLSLNKQYRQNDLYHSLATLRKYTDYPKEARQGKKKIFGTSARYSYLTGEMRTARKYFLKSKINLKTVLYYLTTFVGSGFVKKHFNIFG